MPVGPFNQTNHDPGRITWTNVRLGRVMQVAYDLPADRISGPDWLFHDVVTIVATVPGSTSVGDFRLMLQNLLVERFKLAVHRETKQVSGYALEIAKNGPKLKESGKNSVQANRGAKPESKRAEACRGLSGGAQAIADYLGNAVGSPVEDRTGLTGVYDVHLEFVPDSPSATAAAAEPGTGIFDAVQSQLGLKLTPKKVPVDTLITDHLEKIPTEN